MAQRNAPVVYGGGGSWTSAEVVEALGSACCCCCTVLGFCNHWAVFTIILLKYCCMNDSLGAVSTEVGLDHGVKNLRVIAVVRIMRRDQVVSQFMG